MLLMETNALSACLNHKLTTKILSVNFRSANCVLSTKTESWTIRIVSLSQSIAQEAINLNFTLAKANAFSCVLDARKTA